MLNNFCVFEELVFFDLWILDSGFQIPDSGFRILDSGFWIPDSGFRIPDSGFRIPDFGFRIPDSGIRIPVLALQKNQNHAGSRMRDQTLTLHL